MVQGDPIILDNVNASSDAVYTCTATASPPANITWFGVIDDGSTFLLSGERTNTSGSTTMSVFSAESVATVETPARQLICRAENDAGTVNATIDIVINGEPVLIW